MESVLPRKQYFLLFAASLIFVASVAVFISCFTIGQHVSNAAAILIAVAGNAAIFLPIAVGIALSIWVGARKPSRPVNYPRIEHLRIARKYTPTNAAKIGVSPLYLN